MMTPMTTATATLPDAATRARLSADAAKHVARIGALDKLLPVLIERHAFYRGRVAEADARRGASALALIEQHLTGHEIHEARLAANLNVIRSVDSTNATAFVELLVVAVAGARAEHADRTTKLADIERRLAGVAA
jgi:hypothetical protein